MAYKCETCWTTATEGKLWIIQTSLQPNITKPWILKLWNVCLIKLWHGIISQPIVAPEHDKEHHHEENAFDPKIESQEIPESCTLPKDYTNFEENPETNMKIVVFTSVLLFCCQYICDKMYFLREVIQYGTCSFSVHQLRKSKKKKSLLWSWV